MTTIMLGGGALGSIFAAVLARAGEDVVLLARGKRAEYLRKNGVTLTGLIEDTVTVPVETDPSALREADLLVVTVKTYDTEAALAPLAHLKLHSVISVQNGVLKNDQLAAVFGARHTLGCIATVSGELLPDGTVLFTQNRGFHVGELPTGVSARVREIVGMFERAGIKALASAAVADGEWSKFAAWLPMMALSVLTRLETGKFCGDPDAAAFAVAMVREAAAVASALGVTLDDSGPLPARRIAAATDTEAIALVRQIGTDLHERAPRHRMSTLQDLDHGKRLEVDETLGHLVRLADERGIPAPASRHAWQLVKAVNRFQG